MALEKAYIPYGGYWSTPFARWQGSLAPYHSIELAGRVGERFLSERGIPPETFDAVALGITVQQRYSFYGAPWLAGLVGMPELTGPTLSQACATSVRVLASASFEIEVSQRQTILAVGCDRTSNGPHIYYPDPNGPGGKGRSEDPVLDNMGKDPYAGAAMVQTAENVAAEAGISREEQDEMALIRYNQYLDALADDRAFQRRFMLDVDLVKRGKTIGSLSADEGIHETTAEGLAGLRPVLDGGTITYGTQTHPADGNAGVIVTGAGVASELSNDPAITIQILSFGEARAEKAFMPKAVVPAAHHALDRAGIGIEDCATVKTHNPFAVSDVYFCSQMGLAPDKVNNYGSTLVWGHPQAPMGMRAIIEMTEELVIRGGGYGLFTGCAGGDSAMALVMRVS